ncbi:MAG TPA: thioredoxin family protein [Terriglobales bacterium]|jgi:thioredoxin 1|nr:thioredoxin family protein [Terriglobales bacterium]
MKRIVTAGLFFLFSIYYCFAQSAVDFDGVVKWQNYLATADVSNLKTLYSTDPPAKFIGADQRPAPDITPETDFWQKMLSSGLSDVSVITVGEQDQQDLHVVSLQISMKISTPNGSRSRYVMEQQGWQYQSNRWRIVVATHSDVLKLAPALKPNPNLSDKEADAHLEVKTAISKANQNHQRVILVFGGNWCYDCHVLDQAFRQLDIASLLEKSFRVVHVDIGDDGKKNNDLAKEYQVPIEKGVPALVILGGDGRLLFSQRNGEWESARSLEPDDIISFLNKWKP